MAHLSLVSSATFKAQRKVTRRASSATSSCYLDGQHSLLSRPYLRCRPVSDRRLRQHRLATTRAWFRPRVCFATSGHLHSVYPLRERPAGGIRCLLIWPGHASLGYLRFTWRRLGCFCVCTCQPWHLTIHSSRRHFAARPNSGVSCYEQQFSVLSNNQYPMGRDAWGGNAA